MDSRLVWLQWRVERQERGQGGDGYLLRPTLIKISVGDPGPRGLPLPSVTVSMPSPSSLGSMSQLWPYCTFQTAEPAPRGTHPHFEETEGTVPAWYPDLSEP